MGTFISTEAEPTDQLMFAKLSRHVQARFHHMSFHSQPRELIHNEGSGNENKHEWVQR